MKTFSYPRLARAARALWLLAIASLTAGQFGDFTYRVDGDQVTITDYPEDAVGHVEIPSKIDDKPVTTLSTPPPRRPGGGHGQHGGRTPPPEYTFSLGAFANCPGITSISIPDGITRIGGGTFFNCAGLQHLELPPGLTELGGHAFAGCGVTSLLITAGVTSISEYAFSDCPALTSIQVEPGNPAYMSIDGVLFDITATTLLQCPEGRAGAYIVPPGTTAIRASSPVLRLPHGAFLNCTRLTGAMFLGDAPGAGLPFTNTAPDFTIYYLSTSTGFTSPTWNGYPAVEINVDQYRAAPWLLEHGLPHDADLHQDINSDGVSLLMAYALDLDPRQNLRSRLPVPTMDTDSLRLTFPASRANLSYTVQTSTDLQTWTAEGVTTSEFDPDGRRTASTSRDVPRRFLRLMVE